MQTIDVPIAHSLDVNIGFKIALPFIASYLIGLTCMGVLALVSLEQVKPHKMSLTLKSKKTGKQIIGF